MCQGTGTHDMYSCSDHIHCHQQVQWSMATQTVLEDCWCFLDRAACQPSYRRLSMWPSCQSPKSWPQSPSTNGSTSHVSSCDAVFATSGPHCLSCFCSAQGIICNLQRYMRVSLTNAGWLIDAAGSGALLGRSGGDVKGDACEVDALAPVAQDHLRTEAVQCWSQVMSHDEVLTRQTHADAALRSLYACVETGCCIPWSQTHFSLQQSS